jgi:hypothetical protein
MVKNLCVCEWEAGDGKEGGCEPEGKATRSTQQHFLITVDCSKHILHYRKTNFTARRDIVACFGTVGRCHVIYSGFIRRSSWAVQAAAGQLS